MITIIAVLALVFKLAASRNVPEIFEKNTTKSDYETIHSGAVKIKVADEKTHKRAVQILSEYPVVDGQVL